MLSYASTVAGAAGSHHWRQQRYPLQPKVTSIANQEAKVASPMPSSGLLAGGPRPRASVTNSGLPFHTITGELCRVVDRRVPVQRHHSQHAGRPHRQPHSGAGKGKLP